ncbi:MAG: hypothetical protein P8X50_17385, partial [Maritimibacter sp.]
LLSLDGSEKEIAKELREIAQEIAKTSLPDRAKRILHRRLSQTASALEHYNAFGLEALEEELDSLVGVLVVSTPNSNGPDKSILQRAAGTAGRAFTVLTKADKGAGAIIGMTDKATEFLDLFK